MTKWHQAADALKKEVTRWEGRFGPPRSSLRSIRATVPAKSSCTRRSAAPRASLARHAAMHRNLRDN